SGGDPRATYGFIELRDRASGGEAKGHIVRVPYRLGRHAKKTLRSGSRGKISRDDARAYLCAILDAGGGAARLRGDDRGELALAKLIGARARDVYGAAAAEWPHPGRSPVHDVRVAARRLREALELASPLADPARWKQAVRRVKRLHSALG